MCQNGQDELPRAVGSTRLRTDRVLGTARLQPRRISARLGRKLCAVKIIDPDSASFEQLCYAGEGRPKDPSFVNPRSEAAWTLHNRLDVPHALRAPCLAAAPLTRERNRPSTFALACTMPGWSKSCVS